MNTLYITLGIIAVLGLFTTLIYNRLIALRQSRRNAFADVDVQLRLRFDLVPNLVNTVKGIVSHENTVLTNITEARAGVQKATTAEARVHKENDLSKALVNLFAVAEAYPTLKANDNFKQLQVELSDIDNKISAARRFFNSATAEYNTALELFPANIVARITGFKAEPFFENTNIDREAVETPHNIQF